jgi:hypothetical protein
LIVVATIVLEIVAYFAYRNTVDGQDAFPAIAIFIYALIAIGVVRLADRFIRRHRDRFANPS